MDGDGEHLGGNHFLELGGEFAAAGLCFVGVDDGGKGFHGFAGDEHVHLDHFGGAVAGVFVVHGAVAAGHGFESVVEVDEDVGEGDDTGEEDAELVDGFGVFEFAPLFHDELHGVADVFTGKHDEDAHHRFTDLFDDLLLGEEGGVVDDEFFAVGLGDLVDDGGVGGDDVHVELAAEAFLDDLHVEETKEAAAEAEAEGGGAFVLEGEGGVVDLKLAHRDLESLEVGGVDGVDAGEDHGANLFEAGEGLGAGIAFEGDGIADFDFGGGLHVGDEVAHVASDEAVHLFHAGNEDAAFFDFVVVVGVEEFDAVAFFDGAGHHAHVGDDAAIGIVEAVEDGGAQDAVVGVDWEGGRAR